ncbi:MAG: hypothetical protein ACLTKE_07655 [Coprococcus sp.]
MAKRLFMITKIFPMVLENLLSKARFKLTTKKFEEIIILVYRANLKEKERIVPKNVKVIPLCDWSKYKKICFYIKLILSLFSKELERRIEKA